MKMYSECTGYVDVISTSEGIFANGQLLPYATIDGNKMFWNGMMFHYVPDYIWDDTLVPLIGGPTSSYFIQSNFSPAILPNQGWKFHISFSSLGEYLFALYYIVPWAKYLDIPFKVLRPSMWTAFDSGSIQDGKFVTLYAEDERDFHKIKDFMKALKNILMVGEAIEVKGELRLSPHVFARYGVFKGKNLTDPYGRPYPDQRGTICPPWITPLTATDIFE